MKNFRIELPKQVQLILNRLEQNGFEAYAVGGCVRDAMLGKNPTDWDMTTSAEPEEVKQLFSRTIDTGIQHGTVTVMLGKEGFEVTTYRLDGKYQDHRRPENVEYTKSLKEDLKRRDFTINAMAYSETKGLVDMFEGMEDIEKKQIRCVGNPADRFSEDALRILRAVRFAAQLGFVIEKETEKAISLLVPTLIHISEERIQTELTKILISENPKRMEDVYRLGISRIVLSELDVAMDTGQQNPHHIYSVGEHSIKSCQYVEPDQILRWTMLLHDIGKPATKKVDEHGIAHFHGHQEIGEKMVRKILTRLKFDNHTIHTVCKLVLYHDYRFPAKKKNIRRAVNKIGKGLFAAFLNVQRGDILAQNPAFIQEKLLHLEQIKQLYEEIIDNEECVELKSLAVNGHDMQEIGFSQGAEIGRVLNQLLEIVLDNPEQNQREILLTIAKNNLS